MGQSPRIDAVSGLIDGAVDLHVHPSPSLFPRQIDQLEAARQAHEARMRAILLKDHHHSTAPDVAALRPVLKDLRVQVFGGIVLNSYVGGLNPYAVELTIRLGGRMVWFPTISSANHIRHTQTEPSLKFPRQERAERPEMPIPVLDERGQVLPSVHEILGLIAEADVALSPGHLAFAEVVPLLRAAQQAGVRRMLVNHPGFVLEATIEQVRELVRLGAYIEHSVAYHHPEHDFSTWPIERLVEWIVALGPEHTVLASDLGQRGQKSNPQPVAGMRDMLGWLLDRGVREQDLELMVKQNPAWLLGLDG